MILPPGVTPKQHLLNQINESNDASLTFDQVEFTDFQPGTDVDYPAVNSVFTVKSIPAHGYSGDVLQKYTRLSPITYCSVINLIVLIDLVIGKTYAEVVDILSVQYGLPLTADEITNSTTLVTETGPIDLFVSENSVIWLPSEAFRVEVLETLPEIDMTATALDSRVRYSCVSNHAYYSEGELLSYAGPNEWPVENRNGIPVGRHEPEPQATNYMTYPGSYYTLYHAYTSTGQPSPDGLNNAVNVITTLETYGTSFCDIDALAGIECTTSIIAKHVSGNCNWVFKQEGNSSSDIIYYPADKEFSRRRRTFTPLLYSNHVRMSFLNYGSLAIGDTVSSFQRQMETGKFATSPIRETGVPVTRAAAYASIYAKGFRGCVVHYNTGATTEYAFGKDEWFVLPWSNQDWGSRYISKIVYVLGGVDRSPIDLTTGPLDERLRFTSTSPHLVRGSDDLLSMAAVNQYPVEYVKGVVVGRSPPERQSSNLFKEGNTAPFVKSAVGNQNVVAGSDSYGIPLTYRYTWEKTPIESNFNISQRVIAIPAAGTYSFSVVLKIIQGDGKYTVDNIHTLLDVYWDSAGTITKSNTRRVEELGNGYYLCAMQFDAPNAGNAYVRIYIPSAVLSSFTVPFVFEAGSLQVEAGSTITSSIATSGTAVTRSAGILLIRTQGASGLKVTYNTSEVENFHFNGEAWFQFPWNTRDWRNRYIVKMEYVVDGPDYSTIDLTTEKLDDRLMYSCASRHTVKTQDGLLASVGINTYPLEYVNGVPIGRHEPEPQSTNLIGNNTKLDESWRGNRVTFGAGNLIAPNGSVLSTIGVYNSTSINSGLYYKTNSSRDIEAVASGWSMVPVRSRVFMENTTPSDYRYINEYNTWQRWVTRKSIGAVEGYSGTVVAYTMAEQAVGDTTAVWGWQFEENRKIPTSPILTSGTAATRAAAFLMILTQKAKGAKLYFSNGNVEDVTFGEDPWHQLPWAKLDWGTRYITKIEYILT